MELRKDDYWRELAENWKALEKLSKEEVIERYFISITKYNNLTARIIAIETILIIVLSICLFT